MGLEAGIWASRLRYGPKGLGEGGTKKKEKEEEKIPHMCESISHRPLRGRCPKRKKERRRKRKRERKKKRKKERKKERKKRKKVRKKERKKGN